MAEASADVTGGEVPVHVSLPGIGEALPGGELAAEDREVVDAPVQALAGQGGKLDLGDVPPRPVLGSVVDLQALAQGPDPGRG